MVRRSLSLLSQSIRHRTNSPRSLVSYLLHRSHLLRLLELELLLQQLLHGHLVVRLPVCSGLVGRHALPALALLALRLRSRLQALLLLELRQELAHLLLLRLVLLRSLLLLWLHGLRAMSAEGG